MTRMSSKTKARVQYIKELAETGLHKYDIRDKFMFHFKVEYRTFLDCWNYYVGGTNGRIGRDKMVAVSQQRQELNQPDDCYFGGGGQVVAHHIGYNPEVVLYISKSNHAKLHNVIKTYHEQIVQKDQTILDLRAKIKKIAEIIK